MALVVEDGTGLSGADSFVSVEWADTHHEARGNWDSWVNVAVLSSKEAALRRASAHLSHSFRWKGLRLRGRSQALSWPRVGVVDAEGNAVPSDVVPEEVAVATAELALAELKNPGSLTQGVTQESSRVLVEVKGIKWENVGGTVPTATTESEKVLDIVAGLLVGGGRSATKFLKRA